MKATFVARVMQIMNEIGWNDSDSDAFVGSDTTKAEKHIESVFMDVWRKAVNLFPKTYFTIRDFSSNELISDSGKGVGFVVLPEDFYTLVSFQMKGWQKASEVLFESSDSIASVQANEYTRGNFCRPICVKGIREIERERGDLRYYEQVKVLEYYSLPKGAKHEVLKAFYIPEIGALTEDTIIGDKLFIPLAYLAASQVFYIYEKSDIAKSLEERVLEIIK